MVGQAAARVERNESNLSTKLGMAVKTVNILTCDRHLVAGTFNVVGYSPIKYRFRGWVRRVLQA